MKAKGAKNRILGPVNGEIQTYTASKTEIVAALGSFGRYRVV